MNKNELINEIVGRAEGLTKKEIEAVYEHTVNIITERVSNGEDVSLRGFGTFKTYLRKSCQAYNFAKDKKMSLPAKHHVNFVAGKRLKDAAGQIPVDASKLSDKTKSKSKK